MDRAEMVKGLAILLVVIMPAVIVAAEPIIHVPHGTPATIDGTVDAEEWADAVRIELPRSTWLLLKHDGDSMYMGIVADEMGMFVGNVCILDDDRFYIYHASAALGTAMYQWNPSTVTWILASDFVWRCRALGFSSTAVRQREQFLADEGWVASISYLGDPEEMEFRVTASSSSLLVWLALLPAYGGDLLNWPEIPGQDLFPGPIPGETMLEPDGLAHLILDPADVEPAEHAP